MSVGIVKNIIAESSGYGNESDILDHLSFLDDLDMDEDVFVDMLGIIEDALDINLEEKADEFVIVEDLVEYIAAEQEANAE